MPSRARRNPPSCARRGYFTFVANLLVVIAGSSAPRNLRQESPKWVRWMADRYSASCRCADAWAPISCRSASSPSSSE
jgi:hypothetical protein